MKKLRFWPYLVKILALKKAAAGNVLQPKKVKSPFSCVILPLMRPQVANQQQKDIKTPLDLE